MDAKSDGTDIHSDFSQRVARMWFGPHSAQRKETMGPERAMKKEHSPVNSVVDHPYHYS